MSNHLRNPEDFAGALDRAHQLVPLLVHTYDSINRYAEARFRAGTKDWPPLLQARQERESPG